MNRRLPLVLVAFAAVIGCEREAADEPARRAGSHLTWQPLPTGTITRIAFGSCAFQWDDQSIWDAVIAAEPDLFLYIGDAIYGDFDGRNVFAVTGSSLRSEWGKLAGVPTFQLLAAHVPVLATWDNHDYGIHDGGAEFPLKDVSKEIFLNFFGEPVGSARREHGGIYDAHIFGPEGRRVQVILLDTRYFKGPPVLAERPEGAGGSLGKYAPNTDPNVTLLGEEQWVWLEQQLHEPAVIRFIVSSTQIVADQKGMDEWGNYPRDRSRLFRLIESTGGVGVIMLSGNVHYSEISQTDQEVYPFIDFTASGLTHVNEGYANAENPYRVAGPFVDLNFGLVEIDWGSGSGPTITFRAIAADGSTGFEHSILLSDLQGL